MANNSDTSNIFSSYLNKVILKEAVDPTVLKNMETYRDNFSKAGNTTEASNMQAAIDMYQKQSSAPQAEPAATQPAATQPAATQPAAAQTRLARKPFQPSQPSQPSQPVKAVDTSSSKTNPNAKKVAQPASPAPAPVPTSSAPTQTQAVNPNDKLTMSLGGMESNASSPTTNAASNNLQKQLDASYAEFQQGSPTKTEQPAAEEQQPPAATQPAATTNSGSIVDYLGGKNQASDFKSRANLAAQYGIKDYKGTAQQNTDLLNKLKSDQQPTQAATQPQQQAMGGALGGASKLAGGAGNIVKGGVSGASKLAGGAGNLVKQGLTGQTAPMGGVLGGISKGLGSVGNVAKGAVKGTSKVAGDVGRTLRKAAIGDINPQQKTEEEENQISEKKNISKFLRHLSEKNYSSAHKYLKAIVENKVNKNILKGINKL